MSINPADATAAYRNAVQAAASALEGSGMEPRNTDGRDGSAFVEMVKSAANQAIQSNREAEALSLKAIAGEAELSEVVTAVANAETALQTVVTVRDRMITAYQEIMRMPI